MITGLRSRLPEAEYDLRTTGEHTGMVGDSPAMRELFRALNRLSRASMTVLINGESGTGKELAAHAVHRLSPRRDQPFIALNMAAIPHDLLESELFGHEQGAFTGARARRPGHFELADGGTLFLDEIGDMPWELQTRLLRVLADGEFYPVGAQKPRRVDVRIVAATHQHLETLVAERRFREDLFYRLNVIRLHIPPLRERRQDIPLLVRHFLGKLGTGLGEEPKTLTPEALEWLCRLPWPGNIRQLENVCAWLAVMVPRQDIRRDDLPPEVLTPDISSHPEQSWQAAFRYWVDGVLATREDGIAWKAIELTEKILIAAALAHTDGHRQQAALRLGYGRNTLTRKIAEMGLDA